MKNFFTKKRIIWASIILVVLAIIYFSRSKTDLTAIQTDKVKKQDLKQTVLATGQVTSQTDLSLSFKTSGVVGKVAVKVGDVVKTGQVLASLEAKDAFARLTQAKGTYGQARANLQKILDGATNEDVAVSQVALENAQKSLEDIKKQQATLVTNAYKTLLNSSLEAIPSSANTNNINLPVSGTYLGTEQGVYEIYQEGKTFSVRGLENAGGQSFSTSVAVPLAVGTRGLYVTFPSTTSASNDRWTITIPNTKAVSYVTNYNAYQSALENQRSAVTSAESAVASAQAALNLKKAQARPADVEAAQAAVTSAYGQVLAAEADYENTIIRAPADGTITTVDVKQGELASATKQAIVLQDVNNLHIEADISEANIASIKLDQEVYLDFDALGSDRKFSAKVQKIDPASTLVSGVVKYKITVGLEKTSEIKPGMTANLSIITGDKKSVLVVPQRAVISRDDKEYVRVITNSEKKTYEEKEVTTGMEGDGGLVELTSGPSENQEIVVFIKAK